MLWFLFATAASFAVYFWFIRPKLKEFRATADILTKIDQAAVTRHQKFKLWLLGQKTVISGFFGILVTTLPDVLDNLHGIDFTAFFTPDLALKISGGILLLMTVFHIVGMVSAAKIEPKKDE